MRDIHDQLRMLESIHMIRPLQLEPALVYSFHYALLRGEYENALVLLNAGLQASDSIGAM